VLAIIGGSGLTQLGSMTETRRKVARTPYGEPSGALTFGRIGACDVVFLARHGYGHTIAPHEVNYRANLWALKDAGQLDNTIVIFSADQGIAVGSHGLLGKQSLYDHSMKSPLVLAGPAIPRGKSDALVYLFDIYPTVADLLGAKVPAQIGRPGAH